MSFSRNMIRPLLCWLIWQKRTSDQDSVEIKTALIMKLLSTKYKRLLTLAVIPLIALNLADPPEEGEEDLLAETAVDKVLYRLDAPPSSLILRVFALCIFVFISISTYV